MCFIVKQDGHVKNTPPVFKVRRDWHRRWSALFKKYNLQNGLAISCTRFSWGWDLSQASMRNAPGNVINWDENPRLKFTALMVVTLVGMWSCGVVVESTYQIRLAVVESTYENKISWRPYRLRGKHLMYPSGYHEIVFPVLLRFLVTVLK